MMSELTNDSDYETMIASEIKLHVPYVWVHRFNTDAAKLFVKSREVKTSDIASPPFDLLKNSSDMFMFLEPPSKRETTVTRERYYIARVMGINTSVLGCLYWFGNNILFNEVKNDHV